MVNIMDIDIRSTDYAPFWEDFTSSFLDDDIVDTEASEKEIYDIMNFMRTLFYGTRLRILPDENALRDVLQRKGINSGSEALLVGSTVYTHKGLRDAFLLIKEFMRSFVETLRQRHTIVFDALLCEAKTNYLSIERRMANDDSLMMLPEETKEEELVAQALAHLFLLSLGKSRKRHNGFRHFLSRYVLFDQDIMGYETCPTFKKTSIGTQLIPTTLLTNIRSLSNFADALNTRGISFTTRRIKR